MTLFDSGRPSGFKGSTALSVTQMSTLRVTCPLALLDTLVTLSSSLPHWCYPSSSSWGPCPDDRHSLPTVTCFPSFAYLCLHSQEASGAPIPFSALNQPFMLYQICPCQHAKGLRELFVSTYRVADILHNLHALSHLILIRCPGRQMLFLLFY